jgi:hypothetical protein
MLKKLAFAAALAVLPATVFAQSSGPTTGPMIRDPAGGTTRDPALAGGMFEAPLARDPAGGTMVDDTRFRTYVMEQDLPSYRYARPVAVGAVLPARGLVYREVPAEFGAPGYRYTVVNERPVVVEPRTRRIVQIID